MTTGNRSANTPVDWFESDDGDIYDWKIATESFIVKALKDPEFYGKVSYEYNKIPINLLD
jgi:hypothetical protein